MGNFDLVKALGFDASGSLRPDAKLLQVLPHILDWRNMTLDQVPVTAGSFALSFKEPLPLREAGLSLTVGTGTGGALKILTAKDHVLDTEDPFASISIGPGEIYLSLSLTFSVVSSAGLTLNPLSFGFAATRQLTSTIYQRFTRVADSFPVFQDALRDTVRAFVFPRSQPDIQSLSTDTVVVLGGQGELKLSSTCQFEMPVQQLAATSPVAGKMIELNTSAGLQAQLGVTLEGEYQARIRRLEQSAIELGIYHSRSRSLTAQVSASAGIAVDAAKIDLGSKFIGALSRQPTVDVQEFQQALPGEDEAARDLKIAAFQKTLSDAVMKDVAVSITEALTSVRSLDSVFTFELEPSVNLTDVLSGDFSAWTANAALPSGVKQLSNVLTDSQVTKRKLAVNLLGLVNFVSLGKLARIAQVERSSAGEITLFNDKADANRLQALLINAGWNAKRLRALLSEDFLFQASFKVSDLQVFPPDLSARHTFFEIVEHANQARLKDILDVCRLLGKIDSAGEQNILRQCANGTRVSLWLQSSYNSGVLEQVFFTSKGAARTPEDFETVGRTALSQLLGGDAGQEFRKQIADLGPAGTRCWNAMKEIGAAANFNRIFGVPDGALDPRVAAAASDFLCITSWAAAMSQVGQTILEVRSLTTQRIRPDNQQLTALREQLRRKMAGAVQHSGEHFGEPLGFLMVYFAGNRNAELTVGLEPAL